MAEVNQPSAIGRPLDPNYPSNLFIIIFTGVGFVGLLVSELLLSGGVLDSLAFAGRGALGIFLTWALGRELEPDNAATATLASVGIVGPIVVWGTPGLVVAAWALLTLRALNRTTGLKAMTGDTIFLTVLSGVLGYFVSPVIAAAGFFVFTADGLARNPNRKHLVSGGIMGLEALALWLISPPGLPEYLTSVPVYVSVLAIGLSYLFVIALERDLQSTGDNSGEPLDLTRIQLTQLIALLLAVYFSLWRGVDGLQASLALWAVFGGTVLTWTYRRLAK